MNINHAIVDELIMSGFLKPDEPIQVLVQGKTIACTLDEINHAIWLKTPSNGQLSLRTADAWLATILRLVSNWSQTAAKEFVKGKDLSGVILSTKGETAQILMYSDGELVDTLTISIGTTSQRLGLMKSIAVLDKSLESVTSYLIGDFLFHLDLKAGTVEFKVVEPDNYKGEKTQPEEGPSS